MVKPEFDGGPGPIDPGRRADPIAVRLIEGFVPG